MSRSDESEFIHKMLCGNPHAIDFCHMVFQISQVWDDLIDRDKPVLDERINNAFTMALVGIPSNLFYQQYMHILVPQFSLFIADWIDANELEKEDSADSRMIAFVLRDSVSGLLIQCAGLVGGNEWARSVSLEIRKHIFEDSFDEYKNGMVDRAEQSSAEYFDDFFNEYKTIQIWQGGLINGSQDQTIEYIFKYLQPVSGKTVIDMGSGKGTFSRILAERGAIPISVVNSKKCYDYQISNNSFDVLYGSYLQTGLPDCVADSIVFLESFCYEDPAKTMEEVVRLLKPGGSLLIKCLAPLRNQANMVEKENEIWKTKFSTIPEIIETVSQNMSIIDFHLLPDCTITESIRFIEEHPRMLDHHKESQVGAFPPYILWAKKEGGES